MTRNTTDTTTRLDRRSVLKALGSAAAVGGMASTATATKLNEICISGPAEAMLAHPYQFAVSGYLQKAAHARDAPIKDEYVTKDPHDDIDGSGNCRVHGEVQGGADCYLYAGDIVAFSIDTKHAQMYDIYINGEAKDPKTLETERDPSDVDCADNGQDNDQSGGHCPFENTLRATPHKTKSEPFEVVFEVSGKIEMPDGRRVKAARITVQGRGTAADQSVDYSGRIVGMTTHGPGYVSFTQNDACEGGGE